MFDQFRKKRLNLTHSFNTNRPRINSSQKRKEIQANLQKFKRDVQQGSHSKSPSKSSNNFYQQKNANDLSVSPTMKDLINPFIQRNKSEHKGSQQMESPRFRLLQDQSGQKLKQSQKIEKVDDLNIKNVAKQQKQSPHKSIQKQIFNESLNKIQINDDKKAADDQILSRQVSFGDQQLKKQINLVGSQKKQDENVIKEMQPSYQNNDSNSNQLNFNYNNSNYGGSSNGSSAIFFTSQFRDYLNRDKPEQTTNNQLPQPTPILQQSAHKKSQASQHPSQYNQTDKQIGQSFLKMGEQQLSQSNEQERTKKMLHNQSGRSLAFSNNDQSMLRQSKINNHDQQQQQQQQRRQAQTQLDKYNYNQFVHDLVNKKLDEELVIQIQHFRKYQLYDFVTKYWDREGVREGVRVIVRDLGVVSKLRLLNQRVISRIKRQCFDGFLMLKQYRFDEVKNQIKVQNFKKQLAANKLKSIFDNWRRISLQNQILVIKQLEKRQQKVTKNIFQVFKMIWFDSKVKKQVDLFYLSKIFSSFKNAIASQQRKQQHLALKHYCKSLKKRYFYFMQEGIQELKEQRNKLELASDHYYMKILKNYFEAWLEQCSKSPQYVSLTMTSKNMFKQTKDNGWLGIKTIDFHQLQDK